MNSGDNPSPEQLDNYLKQNAPRFVEQLFLSIDGERRPLTIREQNISLVPGAGGLPTLRVELDLMSKNARETTAARRLHFANNNYSERLGWRELMVAAGGGSKIYDSSAFGSAITDELRAYPQDMLMTPLDEREADLSFGGVTPAGAAPLRARDGRPAVVSARDYFAELIAAPDVTPRVAALGLLFAALLGAFHAFSPGHGKTVVGAYLVGARGTARHAAFLGLTVTITHTVGVFALGLVTLYASQYVVPEKLYPVLSFVSGAIVLALGLTLFVRRLFPARQKPVAPVTEADHTHSEQHDAPVTHSHGGRVHSHLPPGADGGRVTWRSLLALGVSGGLLPCPSALVVLLSAISLHRVGYGLALVFAFSVGLAATLTAIGLVFLYAGRLLKRSSETRGNLALRVLPALSSLVIACVGAAICYEALR
jgi:ABC-type nickel/cobalt efflux system permease component RcnA